MGKPRPAKMHTGNQQVFAGGLGKNGFPRRSGLYGIAIKSDSGGGPRGLNMRKVDDIAPNQQALPAASMRNPLWPAYVRVTRPDGYP